MGIFKAVHDRYYIGTGVTRYYVELEGGQKEWPKLCTSLGRNLFNLRNKNEVRTRSAHTIGSQGRERYITPMFVCVQV